MRRHPRVLIDTNVFIIYLLSAPQKPIAVRAGINAMSLNCFALLMPQEVLKELDHVLSSRPYLMKMIDPSIDSDFIAVLRMMAESRPVLTEVAPSVVRDNRDDYLIEQARRGDANYLVSGDRELLALAESIAMPRIVGPTEFVALLG